MKTILEIRDGKITKGNTLPRVSYKKFEPLFKALKDYIIIIRIDDCDVMIFDQIPPEVILKLSTDLQKLLREKLKLCSRLGQTSPIVHLPSCSMILAC